MAQNPLQQQEKYDSEFAVNRMNKTGITKLVTDSKHIKTEQYLCEEELSAGILCGNRFWPWRRLHNKRPNFFVPTETGMFLQ